MVTRTMLSWPHGTGIYVHVWINLDRRNLQACSLQQEASRGCYSRETGDDRRDECISTRMNVLMYAGHIAKTFKRRRSILSTVRTAVTGQRLGPTNYTLPNAANDTPRNDDVLCHIEFTTKPLEKGFGDRGRGQLPKQCSKLVKKF